MRFYLSTIATDAARIAKESGFGLEIAEYCTAWNMDNAFPETHASVLKKIDGCSDRILHGPFNELFPCAIDPKARELAAYRYRQALSLANKYGAEKLVIHGGYNPWLYYPVWYTEQSILFWKDFIKEVPQDMQIVLENVLEEEPSLLLTIVREVQDPRLAICLDVGHVNAYSRTPVMTWLEQCAPCISHLHIHNNDGSWDTHRGLDDGTLPMAELLNRAESLCPDVTVTLEVTEAEPSVKWLKEEIWNK